MNQKLTNKIGKDWASKKRYAWLKEDTIYYYIASDGKIYKGIWNDPFGGDLYTQKFRRDFLGVYKSRKDATKALAKIKKLLK